MNEKNNHKSPRGQILPMSLGIFLLLAVLVFLLVNVGRLVLERERVHHRTDVVTFSGGVDYARGLNLLSLSNKILGGGALVAVASLGSTSSSLSAIQKGQDILAGTGNFELNISGTKINAGILPVYTIVALEYLGTKNKLLALPLWNQEKLSEYEKIIPNFNVARRMLGSSVMNIVSKGSESFSATIKKQAPSIAKWLYPEEDQTYSHKVGNTGTRKTYSSEETEKINYVDQRGQTQSRYRKTQTTHDKKQPFLKKDKAKGKKFKMDIPLDLKETGPHRLTVWAFSSSENRHTGRMIRDLPSMIGVAKCEIAGGNLSMLKFENGSTFDPYLIPVMKNPNISFYPELKFPGRDLPIIGGIIRSIEKNVTSKIKNILPIDLDFNTGIIH